jgi:hypothetical protein
VSSTEGGKSQNLDWIYIEFGTLKGYIYKGIVQGSVPPCLQDEFPYFFQSLNLDITQIHYWGRLEELKNNFTVGESL